MSAEVVRLPTAAPRMVHQRWNKGTRALRQQLPQFPRERWLFPSVRKQMDAARAIKEIEPSVALVIASAVYRVLSETDQSKVQIYAALAAGETAVGKSASAWLRMIGDLTNGERHDLNCALRHLDEGGE